MGMKEQIAELIGGGSDATTDESGQAPGETSGETREEETSETQSTEGEEGQHEEEGQDTESQETSEGSEESTGVESSEETSESSESSESEEEKSENQKLREELERLSAQINQNSPEQSQESQESQEESSGPTLGDSFDPLGDRDFDSIVESKESFTEWAKEFAEKIQKQTHEAVLEKLPDTVSSYVDSQVTIREKVKDFYEKNSDLAQAKKYVGVVANQVAAEHSDWEFDDVLAETARRSRETLGLKQQAEQNEKASSSQKKSSPAFSGGTKTGSAKRSAAPELSELEKEIDELINY